MLIDNFLGLVAESGRFSVDESSNLTPLDLRNGFGLLFSSPNSDITGYFISSLFLTLSSSSILSFGLTGDTEPYLHSNFGIDKN